jgi:hypothetical protein
MATRFRESTKTTVSALYAENRVSAAFTVCALNQKLTVKFDAPDHVPRTYCDAVPPAVFTNRIALSVNPGCPKETYEGAPVAVTVEAPIKSSEEPLNDNHTSGVAWEVVENVRP